MQNYLLFFTIEQSATGLFATAITLDLAHKTFDKSWKIYKGYFEFPYFVVLSFPVCQVYGTS